MRKPLVVFITLFICVLSVNAQDITTHVYRKVAPENLNKYLKNEVNYWSKFVQSEIDNGNLKFWAVLQRVGGENQMNEPNILLITQISDINKPVNWVGVHNLFPNKKLKDLMMHDLFEVTDEIYLRDLENDINAPNIIPSNDYKYVRINYHNMKDIWWHLNFEAEHVKPFFKKAMDEGKTSIKGWSNSLILTPKSDAFRHKTCSSDYFSTLRDALGPNDFPDMDFPEDFYEEYLLNYVGERNVRIYKIITFIKAEK